MADEPPIAPWLPLPAVFAFLGPRDLLRASATCKLWHRVATSDCNQQWASFFNERWRLPARPSIAASKATRPCNASQNPASTSAAVTHLGGTGALAERQPAMQWHRLFSQHVHKTACYQGRWRMEEMYGHRMGVRALKMHGGLMATGKGRATGQALGSVARG